MACSGMRDPERDAAGERTPFARPQGRLRARSGSLRHAASAAIPPLLRALVAYELIIDFLDEVHERHPTVANGLQLHAALADAVEPTRGTGDYYRYHPGADDGGYLATLVRACRDELRAASVVRPRRARGEGRRPPRGGPRPQSRSRSAHPRPPAAAVGRAGATGCRAGVVRVERCRKRIACCARTARGGRRSRRRSGSHADRARLRPWPLLSATMLDSYADLAADAASGAHSYLLHYDSPAAAVERLHECVSISMRRARALPGGGRHAVIVACMIALFLSSDGANSPELRDDDAGARAQRRLARAAARAGAADLAAGPWAVVVIPGATGICTLSVRSAGIGRSVTSAYIPSRSTTRRHPPSSESRQGRGNSLDPPLPREHEGFRRAATPAARRALCRASSVVAMPYRERR